MQDQSSQTLAAVDLGSNSFHMVVARLDRGRLQIIDKLKERVQLAGGFGEDKTLTDRAQDRALEALERFGQRIQSLPHDCVRAVGTNTLRRARNRRLFLSRAEAALGHPIEVVSGAEEARLIYLGVAYDLARSSERRLVVDIGGGSTECILGEGLKPQETESMHMGCVSYSLQHFGGGQVDSERFRRASLAARLELAPIRRRFRSVGWQSAVGASGTIRAVDKIIRANGWADQGITLDAIRRLRKAIISTGRVSKLSIPGLSQERASVLPGGLAILHAVFKSFQIDRMRASQGALREGLLYELNERLRDTDIREATIADLMDRFGVDAQQARRVEATALRLLDQVVGGWGLMDPDARRHLAWAARLHEVGLAISHSSYHKHGHYLLRNCDLPGFSRDEQTYLAQLVRCHRRRLRSNLVEELHRLDGEAGLRLAMILRLAVRLNRSRADAPLWLRATADHEDLELQLAGGSGDELPMTLTDLQSERQQLAEVGYRLHVVIESEETRGAAS